MLKLTAFDLAIEGRLLLRFGLDLARFDRRAKHVLPLHD